MKKRLMLLIMVCALVLGAIPAGAVQPQFSVVVQAEQKEVKEGDKIRFTVVAQGEDVVALQFNVEVPEGLEFVSGSGALSKGLREKLGVAAVDWTEGAMIFTYYNDVGVTIPKETVLMTFECVAKKAGSYQLELVEVLPFNSEFEEFTPSVKMASVTVKKAGEQGGEEPVVTQPSVDPTTPSTEPVTEPTSEPVTEPTSEATEPSSDLQPTEPSDGTEPENTTQSQPDPTEDTEQTTQPSSGEKVEPTTGSTGEDAGDDDTKSGTGLTALWIGLAVAAVAAAAGILLYLRKKKKT